MGLSKSLQSIHQVSGLTTQDPSPVADHYMAALAVMPKQTIV
jgi:hypothetical protein